MDTTDASRELHLTVANEDYLECIVRIEEENGSSEGIRSVDIAQHLDVSKASVNKAISALKERGLAEQSHYGKVLLTEKGRELGASGVVSPSTFECLPNARARCRCRAR